jgi:hypothetical protein
VLFVLLVGLFSPVDSKIGLLNGPGKRREFLVSFTLSFVLHANNFGD